jgi:NADPH:quinone reductase-like Zn-dependent oxidoreductase
VRPFISASADPEARPSSEIDLVASLTHTGQHWAALVDAGRLRTTVSEQFSPINAANLRRAHELVESGRMRGKVVLSGFQPR